MQTHKPGISSASFVAICVFLSSSARADFNLSPVAVGNYEVDFGLSTYFAGNDSRSRVGFANVPPFLQSHKVVAYFAFDLSSVDGIIHSLSLSGSAANFQIVNFTPFDFQFMFFDIHDVNTPLSELQTSHTPGLTPGPGDAGYQIFQDLNTGNSYGSFYADNGIDPPGFPGHAQGPNFLTDLKSQAVTDAISDQKNGSLFIVAVSGTPVEPHGLTVDLENVVLTVRTVPEPSSFVVLVIGGIAVFGYTRRRDGCAGVVKN